MLEIVAKLDPFKDDVLHEKHPAGVSVVDIIDDLAVRTNTPIGRFAHAAVLIDERKVPFEMWHIVKPKDGHTVLINVLPGDDFGSLLVTLAGFALAYFVPPLGAFTIGGINVGQFLVRGTITLATMLVSQAIAPTPTQSVSNRREDTPASYAITGSRNDARPYDPVPIIYGRITDYHPPYAALPYTETWGGDTQYIRMLFCTEGQVSFSNIKIGDTPIGNLKNFSYETRTGAPTDTPPTLFPRQVREDSVSIELKQPNGFTYRTTEPDTDEVSIEIVFPNGMGRVSDRNVKFGINVQFQVLYYGPGMTGYNAAPLQQGAGGGVTINGGGVFTISGYSKAVVRRAVRFLVPRGQYSVGIARLTVDDQSDNTGKNQSTTFETSYLSTIRSIRNEPPVNRTGLAYISVFAQASEQLNGVIDTLNCTAQGLVPMWNGSTWTTPQPTRNPAWAFVHVLKNFYEPLDDSRIDLDQILVWANYCDSLGITFDAVFDRRTDVWSWLKDIAATGFASPHISNDKYTVIIDMPQTTPVQHFSARNVRNFNVTKLFANSPHALKIRFPNEAARGQIDELVVYADGYNESNAVNIEALDLPYTRSAANAYKAARRYILTGRLRPRFVTFDTDLESLVCQRNSLVRVAHPTILIGTGAARIKARTFNGSGDLTDVQLDAPMDNDTSNTYAIRARKSDGTSIIFTVATTGTRTDSFTLVTPIASGGAVPDVGDLALFGIEGTESREMLVRSIEWQADLTATLTCIDYSPEIFTSMSGPLPIFNPGISLPPTVTRAAPPRPIILSVDSDEDALMRLSDGTCVPRVLIAYEIRQTVAQLTAIRIVARWRLANGAADPEYRSMPALAGQVSITPVEEGQTYLIEMRSESEFGATSEWVQITHTVVGAVNPPPGIETVYRKRDVITWPYDNPPIDLAGFRVKAHTGTSTDWVSARLLTLVLLTTNEFDISEFDGTTTFLIKPVDVRGNEALEAASLTINLGDPVVENVILTQNEHTSWSGSLTGGTVSGGNILADSTTNFWKPDAEIFWEASGDFWPIAIYEEMVYAASYAPLSDHVGATVKLSLDVTGTYAIDYRQFTAPLFWGSGTFWGSGIFWAASVSGAWMPWPGVVGPIASTSEEYEIRLTVAGGSVQGNGNEMSLLIDVPDIEEFIESFDIAASGTVRLPIAKTYRVIDNVQLTREDDGGTAVEVYYVDKNATLGPEVRARNAAGTRVAGRTDARIKGH